MLQPVPQLRVRQPPPEPSQRIPVADRQDSDDDQIEVGGTTQPGEVVVPEEGEEDGGQLRTYQSGVLVFSHGFIALTKFAASNCSLIREGEPPTFLRDSINAI